MTQPVPPPSVEERLASLEVRQDKGDADKRHERRVKNLGLLVSAGSLLVALCGGTISYFNYATARRQSLLTQPDIRVIFEEGFCYDDVVDNGGRGGTYVGKIAFRIANYGQPVTVESVNLEAATHPPGMSRALLNVEFTPESVAEANAIQPAPRIQYGEAFFGKGSQSFGVLSSPPLPCRLDRNEGVSMSTPVWIHYETGVVSVRITTGDTFTFVVPSPEKRHMH